MHDALRPTADITWVLAFDRANLVRTLAVPEKVEHWSLTTLRERVVTIGARIVRHGRSLTF